ncbi:hypothetical protein LCGC14_1712980 [marine sediment metagenome]|uniref:DNA (cytosine-5-)-methyltransferase n=1 Tax=marine sediment metagenome TaxID=412755 RepID=A0A0F9HEB1_9ZZZZ
MAVTREPAISEIFYNENDPFAAQWLRNLGKADLIPRGEVDERSIKEIRPEELADFQACHFFGGIGGWAYALRLAGWPADRPVWTGSCPCQPFSQAGQGKGEADERHLWPDWFELIRACLPPTVFGEQVASKDGRAWLSGVRADLEALGYEFGAADLCAAGIAAPHIRQRLFWVADAKDSDRRSEYQSQATRSGRSGSSGSGGLGDTNSSELERRTGQSAREEQPSVTGTGPRADGPCGWLGNPDDEREGATKKVSKGQRAECERAYQQWDDGEPIPCIDGKSRRTQRGALPLAHRLPRSLGDGSARSERLRLGAAKTFYRGCLKGFGNAIVADLAAEFVKAYMEARPI